jgi:hypothetical protein
MPLNTSPVESVYTAICSHEESSTRGEGAFFSVAMTTPSLAARGKGALGGGVSRRGARGGVRAAGGGGRAGGAARARARDPPHPPLSART